MDSLLSIPIIYYGDFFENYIISAENNFILSAAGLSALTTVRFTLHIGLAPAQIMLGSFFSFMPEKRKKARTATSPGFIMKF